MGDLDGRCLASGQECKGLDIAGTQKSGSSTGDAGDIRCAEIFFITDADQKKATGLALALRHKSYKSGLALIALKFFVFNDSGYQAAGQFVEIFDNAGGDFITFEDCDC